MTLQKSFLQKKTHVVGTIRSKAKNVSIEVLQAKLKEERLSPKRIPMELLFKNGRQKKCSGVIYKLFNRP